MNSIIERLIRSSVAVFLPQALSLLPGMVSILPVPYNLILTPILMGIGKGLRDGFPKANWIKWIPV